MSGENWVEISEGPTGSKFHYDSDTLKAVGTGFRVWIMADHSKDKRVNERSAKDLMLIDCQNETLTVQAYYIYGPDGQLIEGNTFKPNEQSVKPIIPGSIGAAIFDAFCKR